jgi:hypothetical protein
MKVHKTAVLEKPLPFRKKASQAGRILSGKALGKLAGKMVASNDPAETAALTEAMVRGFYGHDIPTPVTTQYPHSTTAGSAR